MPFPSTTTNLYPDSRSRLVEVLLLAACIFSLPLWEAPKNILWVSWLAAWHCNRWQAKDYGGRWSYWDTLFAAWLVSALLVAVFAGLHADEWRGTHDIIRLVSVGWLTSRAGYTNTEKALIISTVVLSLLAGLGWAFVSWLHPHSYLGIQLHSVGHVNQTAIFMATCWTLLLALMLIFWGKFTTLGKAVLLLTISASLIGFMLASSRAATAFIIFSSLGVGLLWMKRSVKPLSYLLAGAALFTLSLALFDTGMRNKTETALAGPNGLLNVRLDIWHSAEAAWKEYPWFGVGLNNFRQIDLTKIRQWAEHRGEPFVSQEYEGSSHAHSLYWNTMAERGLIGSLVVIVFLLSALTLLIRRLPNKRSTDWDWLWWYAAAGSLSCIILIGVVNTTLHSEHGLLALLLISFWLSSLRSIKARP